VAAAKLRFGDKVPAVVTLRPQEIGQWITGLPRAHSDGAVRFLTMLAEERGTWHVDAVVINDTLRHVQRFERLERDRQQAEARRALLRKARVVAVLAVPAGALLGYWWAAAITALGA
jgi:predicted nucleic acid-binding protein